ncbi:hypothetical protein [Candidatus Nitrospira allomarina]|uniref:Uncharacterized protein n=1 Tax=Candidatus Nitrospira allomarina TaxID=3020900 RepID=A0AA96GGJ5_9BACT|nr:hypothetical protein [Candidatus Nitrospira allomarina]WNM57311.1 hypothetical protein PP769_15230 [Candidatus Nitrospira allomarina]
MDRSRGFGLGAGKLAEFILTNAEGLKHCPPFSPDLLDCSAMPPGQGGLDGKSEAGLRQGPLNAKSDPPMSQPTGVGSK